MTPDINHYSSSSGGHGNGSGGLGGAGGAGGTAGMGRAHNRILNCLTACDHPYRHSDSPVSPVGMADVYLSDSRGSSQVRVAARSPSRHSLQNSGPAALDLLSAADKLLGEMKLNSSQTQILHEVVEVHCKKKLYFNIHILHHPISNGDHF